MSGNDSEDELEKQEEEKKYDHIDQFSYLYGPNWKYLPSISITIYLTLTAISKCIMTGNTLEKVFSDAIEGDSIIKSFNFWLAVFFVFGSLFSFRSIDKTKVMQFIIISVRIISILMMFGGAIYLTISGGVKKLTPDGKGTVNFENFV